MLGANGIKVLTVREVLAYNVDERLASRLELEGMAAAALTYQLAPGEKVMSLICNRLLRRDKSEELKGLRLTRSSSGTQYL